MAILDTLITQLTQGAFSLAKTAPQIRNNITGKKQNTTKLHHFRQGAMGAMALFTGGHCLNSLHNDDAHHMSNALDTFIQQISAPPHNITTTSLNTHPPQSLPSPDYIALNISSSQDITTPPQQPINKMSFVPQSPTRSPPPTTARHSTPAQQDWKALLTQSNNTVQRALREVEPSLHNVQHAFTTLTRIQPHNASSAPMAPIQALQYLSALTTVRGVLAAMSPQPLHGIISPQHTATARIKRSRLRSAPLVSPKSNTIPASPVPPRKQNVSMHHLRQLEHIIHHATAPSSDIASHTLPNIHAAPSLMALSQHLEAVPPAYQRTTHHTTTHSPNVHITVNAAQGSPDDLAHMIEESAVKSLTRHTLFRTG